MSYSFGYLINRGLNRGHLAPTLAGSGVWAARDCPVTPLMTKHANFHDLLRPLYKSGGLEMRFLCYHSMKIEERITHKIL